MGFSVCLRAGAGQRLPALVRRGGLFCFSGVPERPKGDSMQEDLRGAESLYAGLPGFESQHRDHSARVTGLCCFWSEYANATIQSRRAAGQ